MVKPSRRRVTGKKKKKVVVKPIGTYKQWFDIQVRARELQARNSEVATLAAKFEALSGLPSDAVTILSVASKTLYAETLALAEEVDQWDWTVEADRHSAAMQEH